MEGTVIDLSQHNEVIDQMEIFQVWLTLVKLQFQNIAGLRENCGLDVEPYIKLLRELNLLLVSDMQNVAGVADMVDKLQKEFNNSANNIH